MSSLRPWRRSFRSKIIPVRHVGTRRAFAAIDSCSPAGNQTGDQLLETLELSVLSQRSKF